MVVTELSSRHRCRRCCSLPSTSRHRRLRRCRTLRCAVTAAAWLLRAAAGALPKHPAGLFVESLLAPAVLAQACPVELQVVKVNGAVASLRDGSSSSSSTTTTWGSSSFRHPSRRPGSDMARVACWPTPPPPYKNTTRTTSCAPITCSEARCMHRRQQSWYVHPAAQSQILIGLQARQQPANPSPG